MPNEQPTTVETQLEIVEPSALEAIERANVDLQISTARRYPRKLAVVKDRMLSLATLDEETAASCFYRLNRQGKAIEGPSIRLAEIAASSFGNLRYGARVVQNNGKLITAQGFCHDLETNVLSTIEVQRRITNRDGVTYSEDMQVVTGNAACAIAARNAIFKVVPFAFVKPIYLAAKQAAVGDITTLSERRTKMVTKFEALGVPAKKICESLGKSGLEEIGLSELEQLIGLYGAIRDGDQTIEEAFPMPAGPTPASEGIKFGAGPETTTKRKRRTKAEMAAARNDQSGSGEGQPEADRSPAMETASATAPPLATPLQGIRNLIAATPAFDEAQFETYLRKHTTLLEPNEKLESLSDDRLLGIQGQFIDLAQQIADTEKPFA